MTRTERISDSCALQGASVPLVVTAGVEQLYTYSWKGMLTDVAEFKSAVSTSFNTRFVKMVEKNH